MTGAAAGTANRLASTETTGMPPNKAKLAGATPICAAAVTASDSASALGPGRRAARGRPSSAMPAVAPTDNHQPAAWTSSGSMRVHTETASASSRTVDAGRARKVEVAVRPAMDAARSTEGSNRVSSANHSTRPTVASQRPRRPRRRSSGPAATSTNATFSPDTAVKWDNPDARNRSTMSGGSARSSPSTNPVNRARSVGGRTCAPCESSRRMRFAAREAGLPVAVSATTVTVTRPTT